MTLGKLLLLSGPQFPHLGSREDNLCLPSLRSSENKMHTSFALLSWEAVLMELSQCEVIMARIELLEAEVNAGYEQLHRLLEWLPPENFCEFKIVK